MHDDAEDLPATPYKGRNLSYAGTFRNPVKVGVIRTLELFTAIPALLRVVRKFEAAGPVEREMFWNRALELMEIPIQTPEDQIARIPKSGPVVIVSNHPHGVVDGLVLAELARLRRPDFKILTRSMLTSLPVIQYHFLPVAFPHEPDALRQNIRMRKLAMDHLNDDGAIIVFPAGQLATSPTLFGQAVEPDWLPFTAKMILKSRAEVVPVFFPGQNSRVFQIANKLSLTLRQGLLLRETAAARGKPMKPVIGPALGRDQIDQWQDDPRGFMAHLRAVTLGLSED
ncbi:MAG: lysophospholipid acyltransferase family protein [Rhodobacteraceae bacterium]|nr:lysophospholipid acyltransferase family protein [Paracoccaceae bacterium]